MSTFQFSASYVKVSMMILMYLANYIQGKTKASQKSEYTGLSTNSANSCARLAFYILEVENNRKIHKNFNCCNQMCTRSSSFFLIK